MTVVVRALQPILIVIEDGQNPQLGHPQEGENHCSPCKLTFRARANALTLLPVR